MLVVQEAYLTKKQMENIGIPSDSAASDGDLNREKRQEAEETARQLCEKTYFPLYEKDHRDRPVAYYFTEEQVIVPTGLDANGLKEKIYAEWSGFYFDAESASDPAAQTLEYLPASEQQTAWLHAHLQQFIDSDGTVTEPELDFLSSTDYLICRGEFEWKQYKMLFRHSGNTRGFFEWKTPKMFSRNSETGRGYSLPVWSYSLAEGADILDGWITLYRKYGLIPEAEKLHVWLSNLAETRQVQLTEEQYLNLKKYYCNADFLRLGNRYYLLSEGIFDDGRCWDVYENGLKDTDKVCCVFPRGEWLSAKAPSESIVEGGLVSIDFGTKSTVAVISDQATGSFGAFKFQKGYGERGALYPTVLKFCDLDRFMRAYEEKAGRPETLWETVSIDDSESAYGSSDSARGIFRSLKQWMLDPVSREAVLRQRDASDRPVILNEYGSDKNTVDPIELYAYYLGLHINNNQDHRIFMRYRLSFSAVCPEPVRSKMRESFRRGLTKSLPESIIQSETLMENFSVDCTCSEPAAYAVCALACMGMPALCQKNFFYGIFDFGGGTCDFNYGIWRRERDERLRTDKYRIGMLGDGGDPFLGGENLLELLAVQLYMDNRQWFRDRGYKIFRPRCYEGGDESFFSASFEAANNLEFLVEQIRGEVWERNGGSDAAPEKFEIDTAGLLAEENEIRSRSMTELQLPVLRKPLERLLVKRIYEGVSAFFNTYYRMLEDRKRADQKQKEVPQLCVFLAGNSCRSKWVRIMFEKYIEEKLDDRYIKKVYVCDPMGSPEFNEHIPSDLWDEDQKEEIEEKISRFGDLDGKTGVAYGLALYGNKVEIENHRVEDYLQYYLGTSVFFDVRVLEGTQGDRLAIGESVPFAVSSVCNLYYTQMIPKGGELRGVKPIMLNGQNVMMEEGMTCFVRADSRTEISIFAAPDDHPEHHDPDRELIFDLQSGRFKKQRTGT